MRKQPKYKSDAFEAIHASADALLQVGLDGAISSLRK